MKNRKISKIKNGQYTEVFKGKKMIWKEIELKNPDNKAMREYVKAVDRGKIILESKGFKEKLRAKLHKTLTK